MSCADAPFRVILGLGDEGNVEGFEALSFFVDTGDEKAQQRAVSPGGIGQMVGVDDLGHEVGFVDGQFFVVWADVETCIDATILPHFDIELHDVAIEAETGIKILNE